MGAAKHVEIHARMASGTLRDRPVIDLAVRANALTAPDIYPLISQPTDADIDLTLSGMKDLSPKTWPERFREIQEAGGKIDVKTARIAQAEWLATGSGALGLTANGRLDGEIRVTVAGLEKLLQQAGVDVHVASGRRQRQAQFRVQCARQDRAGPRRLRARSRRARDRDGRRDARSGDRARRPQGGGAAASLR